MPPPSLNIEHNFVTPIPNTRAAMKSIEASELNLKAGLYNRVTSYSTYLTSNYIA